MSVKLTIRLVNPSQASSARLRNAISKKMASEFVENMKDQARRRLTYKTSDAYIRGLSFGGTEGGETRIYLKGWLPLALERGISRFDMKPGLLAGPKARLSKSGARYNVIPIQIGTLGDMPNFRVVSDKSPKRSWIHPGLEPRNFVKTAVESLRREYPVSIRTSEGRGLASFF